MTAVVQREGVPVTRPAVRAQDPAPRPPTMRGPAAGASGSTRAVLPPQRAPSARPGAGRPDSDPAPGSTEVLLLDTEAATLATLRDELISIGVGPVTIATEPEAGPPAPNGALAVVSLRFGSRAAAMIRALGLRGWHRILALSATAEPGPAIEAMQAGATGIVVARRVSATTHPLPAGVHDLSTREIEVIRMVADGRSNKWIGDHLDLSALTVKSHLARIGRKLGTGDRAHIVALALRAGVIT